MSVLEPNSRETGVPRTRFDKAFCVEWIDNATLAVSTKSGHILRVDRASRTYQEVDLEGVRWVEPPIVTEEDLHRQRVDRGGIHCVRANASQNLLACSGGRREDHKVYVLNLKSHKWATVRRGAGHTDWVFTLNWISDSTFITGGRDSAVMLWQPGATTSYDMAPVAYYREHEAKVRCSGHHARTQRLATLDVAGRVLLWDTIPGAGDLRVLRSFALHDVYRDECTCLCLDDNLLVVGAREWVTLYDMRRSSSIAAVPLAKLGYSEQQPSYNSCAARSLACKGCLLSVGMSTAGGIMFLDKRNLSSCVDTAATADHDGTRHTKVGLRRASAALASCSGSPHPRPSARVARAVEAEALFAGLPVQSERTAAQPGGEGGTAEGRYSLRNRQKLQPPGRFHAFVNERPPVLASQLTPTVDLTGRWHPAAMLRQPSSEIHYDEVAHYGLANDNAIFSHAWAPDGCAMFACGGPLAMGVRGCHLAMWA